MDRGKILREIGNWENEEYLKRVAEELNEYSQKIDVILYKRYMRDISEQTDQNLIVKAVKRLRKRNLIDEERNLVKRENDVVFDFNVPAINGAHDSATDKIVFNPKGAKCFYQSYLQFADGKRDGIRDLDYKMDISQLPELTPSEILYWCYQNGITYEQFCKVTLLHENVHKWTLRGATGFVAVMMGKDEITLIEGLVEEEARAVASENPELLYLHCFRNEEVDFVRTLCKYQQPNNFLLYSSADKFEIAAIISFLQSKGVSADNMRSKFDEMVSNITEYCDKRFSRTPTSDFERSFYDIFLSKEQELKVGIDQTFPDFNGQSLSDSSERRGKIV